MKDDLRDSVELLYQVFAGYQLRDQMEYCDHCVSPEEVQVLQEIPLRTLSGQQLKRFAFQTMTTWGDEQDFKHFLPRILELLATDELDSWLLLGKTLGTCCHNGQKWPQAERDAIGRFRDALWRGFLPIYPSVLTPLEMLKALAEDDQPIVSYLNEWNETDSTTAVWHLRDMVADFMVSSWSDDLFCRELDAWLAEGTPAARLREAASRSSDEDALVLLDRADRIDAYCQWMIESGHSTAS